MSVNFFLVDKNLDSWCSSTSDTIDTVALSKVRDSVPVYCSTTATKPRILFNTNETSDVSSSMKSDYDRCSHSTSKRELVRFWKLHPVVRDNCCLSATTAHIAFLNSLMNFNGNFYSLICYLVSSEAIGLRKELKSLCSASLSDAFCPINAALSIIDSAALLPSNKTHWTSDTSLYSEAILAHSLVLKKKYPSQFSALNAVEKDVLTNCINAILKYMQNKQVKKLQAFAKYLPPNDAYTTKNGAPCGTDNLCIFIKIVKQVRLYIDEVELDTNPVLINGKQILVLNTEVDYREFLRQKQLDRILTVLSEQHATSLQIANHLKKHMTSKFTELRGYFEKVETFNQQIASTNIQYIKARLEKFKKAIAKIKPRLEDSLTCLIAQAMVVGGLDISSKLRKGFVPLSPLTDSYKSIWNKGIKSLLNFPEAKELGQEFNEILTKCVAPEIKESVKSSQMLPVANEQFFETNVSGINNISKKIVSGGKNIVKGAFTGNIGQVLNGIGGTVGAINPIGTLIGGKSGILNGLDDVTDLLPLVAKMKLVYKNFRKLKIETEKIRNKLEKNDDFLEDMENIIEKDSVSREKFKASTNAFLREYQQFDPRVEKYEIEGMSATWRGLITAACSAIDSVKTPEAAKVQGIVYSKGLCSKSERLAEQLISLYSSIYDFQFELIDALIHYVKSSVAIDAAKEVKTEFSEISKVNTANNVSLTTLSMMGGLSYMTFQVHVFHTVQQYCNVLEYMEGGKRPQECKGINTDLALLVANTEPICISETARYYSIPTTPSNETDLDYEDIYVDVTNLFKGDSIKFQIPSSQWLVDNEWIRSEEIDFAFYVKQFNVFLPTKTIHPHYFYSSADPILHNAVVVNSTEYVIIPSLPLIYEYSMGPPRLICQTTKHRNPYTSCEMGNQVSEICQLSRTYEHHLYPSIYSQWELKIEGGEELTPPNAATDYDLLVGLQLCKIAPNNYIHEKIGRVQEDYDSTQCCQNNSYRPSLDADCEECPAESQSALAGYYCEKQ